MNGQCIPLRGLHGCRRLFLKLGMYMSLDDFWLHLYVMISRVRHISRLLLFHLPDKALFERGPPLWMQRGLAALETKAECPEQRRRIAKALEKMEWSASERRAEEQALAVARSTIASRGEALCSANCVSRSLEKMKEGAWNMNVCVW